MVRNIVGSLIYVGTGRNEPDWMAEVLAARSRDAAAPTFMPDGLYLAKIDYDPKWGLPQEPAPPLPGLALRRRLRLRGLDRSMTMHRTRIKICGITREQDLRAAVDAGADALGFVFYPKSPRYVAPERCAALARALPPFVSGVALFVNADRGRGARRRSTPGRSALLQFHGDETRGRVRAPSRPPCKRPFMRAFRVKPDTTRRRFARIGSSIPRRQPRGSRACCSTPGSMPTAAQERSSIGLLFQKSSRLGSF